MLVKFKAKRAPSYAKYVQKIKTHKNTEFTPVFTILPQEDPQKFEQLRDQVLDEWRPSHGVTEDAALDIARAMWLRNSVREL